MKRDNALNYIPLIEAFAEGKTIQGILRHRWVDLDEPKFTDPPEQYRIKPEPKKCRPYRRYMRHHGSPAEVQVFIARTDGQVNEARLSPAFLGWIDTEWQTHELPNQD